MQKITREWLTHVLNVGIRVYARQDHVYLTVRLCVNFSLFLTCPTVPVPSPQKEGEDSRQVVKPPLPLAVTAPPPPQRKRTTSSSWTRGRSR